MGTRNCSQLILKNSLLPDGVLPLWGSDDLDLDGGRSQGSNLLLHTVSNTGGHGGASRHDSVGVQVLPDVNIALHDGVEGGLVDTTGLHSQEGRLEESLRVPEPLVTDGDDLTVGQLIGLLQGSGSSSSGHLLLEVEGDIAEFLLDVPDNLPLGSGGEGVATLSEDLHQVVGELTSSQVQTDDGVRESVTFIDGDTMGDTVTSIMTIPVVRPEAYRGSTQLVVEGVVPDLLHVVPVGDDSVLNRVLEGEDTSLGLGLISNIGVLLSHTYHDTNVSWAAHNGGEDGPGGVVSGEPGLAHAGAIVTD